PDAIGFADAAVLIGREQHAKVMFFTEVRVLLHGIARHPDDNRARRREGLDFGGEVNRLRRAAGGVVFGVEVEHDFPALQRGKAHLALGAVRRQGEVRGFVSDIGHVSLLYIRHASPRYLSSSASISPCAVCSFLASRAKLSTFAAAARASCRASGIVSSMGVLPRLSCCRPLTLR